MKYILTLIILTGIWSVQSQKYFFPPDESEIVNQSSRIEPYSIVKNKNNQQFIKENDLTLVFESQNWLFVNAQSSFMEASEKNGKVSGVFHDLSIPQVLTDSAVIQHQADQVHAGFGGLDTSYTGKGVIIGVIDQGIDYNHPDFQNPDGSTRVLRYWDHSVNGPHIPSEYGFGCVWNENDINQGICTSIETGSTHGTNVAGMAASNASANGTNIGFAPEASLIVVETDFSINNWSLSIAQACDYIFKVADSLNMPAVINISLGSYYGTHDGLDPASEMIDSLLNAKEGRIVVCAAGNSGKQGPYHVHGEVTQDTSFVWMIPNPAGTAVGSANTILVEFCTDTVNSDFFFSFSADRPAPFYDIRGKTQFHHFSQGVTMDGTVLEEPILNNNGEVIAHAFIYRQLLREQIIGQIAVFDPGFAPIDSSSYRFRFQTYGSGQYDFWGGANVVPTFPHSEFETNIPDTSILPDIAHYHMPDTLQTIVDLWNCSERVISVGNVKNRMGHTSFNGTEYVGPTPIQVGEIAMTSSKGPNRIGIVKPDVSAAGDISLASGSFSWLNNPANHGNMDEGGLHVRNGGTSMASPAVAGIAALYLQKCSKANYNDFKTDLTNNTVIDSFTGSVPNYAYGYGKANALSTVLAKHQSVTIDGPNGICPGGSIDLSFVSGMNPILIQWSNGSNASTIVTTIPNDYTVNLEDDLGCISRSPIHPVSIYSDPVINAGSDQLICPNTQTVLNATGTASVYEWTNNVVNGEPFYPSSGIYIVTGTNTSGCSSQDSLSIEFLSTLPVSYNESITTIGVNQNAFNVSPGDPLGGVYSGNGIIGTSFHPALAGVGLHYVTYSYTDGNGCIASDSSAIEVYEDAGLNDQEDKEWLIYPNPTSNELFIEVYTPVKISIQDMTGRIVFTDNTSTPKLTSLKNLKSGIYVLSLLAIGSNQEKTFRIIKN